VPHQLSRPTQAWQPSKRTIKSCHAHHGQGNDLQSSSSRAATPITGMATIFKAHHQGLPRPSRAWQPSKRDRLKADRWKLRNTRNYGQKNSANQLMRANISKIFRSQNLNKNKVLREMEGVSLKSL
jgi:hypothetical protein